MIPKRKKNKKLFGFRIPVPDKAEKIIVSKKEKYDKRTWARQLEEELNEGGDKW